MKKSPQQHLVEVEDSGTTHSAYYTVESGVLTVFYGLVTNQAVIRGSPERALAKMLLREILQGNAWNI